MNPLPIVATTPIGGDLVQTVRGRDVHAFLEIGKDYSTWMKAQIERARLREGRDFIVDQGLEVSPQKGENLSAQDCAVAYQGLSPRGGRPRIEHHLTTDAAKHVGMMSGTDRGHDLREYFLDCERRAREISAQLAPKVPQSLPEALRLAADLAEANASQAKTIAVLTPRSEALATIAEGEGTFCVRDAAKALQTTETALRSYLTDNGWLYRRETNGPWCARAERLRQGYMTTKVIPVPTASGKPWNRPQARVTSRGLCILAMRLGKPIPPEASADFNLSLPAPARA